VSRRRKTKADFVFVAEQKNIVAKEAEGKGKKQRKQRKMLTIQLRQQSPHRIKPVG
jgi:hypothetical protein